MIKPTVKPMTQLPKTKQVVHEREETAHSEHNQRKSNEYHATTVDKMNPTKTKPNKLTVTSYPGLAN